MRALGYLIYGYRTIQRTVGALVSALDQRDTLRFGADFAVADDAGPPGATIVTFAAGTSGMPSAPATDNLVLQTLSSAATWNADYLHGAAPAATGAIRLSSGDAIKSAGALSINSVSLTEIDVSAGDMFVTVAGEIGIAADGGPLTVETLGADLLKLSSGAAIELDATGNVILDGAIIEEKSGGTSVGNVALASREVGRSNTDYEVILGQDGDNSAVRTTTFRGADNAASHGQTVVIRAGKGSSVANSGTVQVKNAGGTAVLYVEDTGVMTLQGRRIKSTGSAASPATIGNNEAFFIYTGALGTCNLPISPIADMHIQFVNATGGDVTLARNGKNINGVAADVTIATYSWAICHYDGTEWFVCATPAAS